MNRGREDKKANDLFFTCSLIEYIARKSKNNPRYIVQQLGNKYLSKIYDLADIYHSENIEKLSDEFIEVAKIENGNFDSVSRCKYSLPTYWDIGKVYKRLILGIAEHEKVDVVKAIMLAYDSYVSDKIQDFNSSFYYDAPQNILNAYIYGYIE